MPRPQVLSLLLLLLWPNLLLKLTLLQIRWCWQKTSKDLGLNQQGDRCWHHQTGHFMLQHCQQTAAFWASFLSVFQYTRTSVSECFTWETDSYLFQQKNKTKQNKTKQKKPIRSAAFRWTLLCSVKIPNRDCYSMKACMLFAVPSVGRSSAVGDRLACAYCNNTGMRKEENSNSICDSLWGFGVVFTYDQWNAWSPQ